MRSPHGMNVDAPVKEMNWNKYITSWKTGILFVSSELVTTCVLIALLYNLLMSDRLVRTLAAVCVFIALLRKL